MPWIHAAAATLLVLGTAALFAFLRWVEMFSDDEAEAVAGSGAVVAGSAPAGQPLRWPPPPAVAAATARLASRDGHTDARADSRSWRRAA